MAVQGFLSILLSSGIGEAGLVEVLMLAWGIACNLSSMIVPSCRSLIRRIGGGCGFLGLSFIARRELLWAGVFLFRGFAYKGCCRF